MASHSLDLIILVPGKDEKETIEGLLLKRYESLGVQKIRFQAIVHIRRDPGVFLEAPSVLQPYLRLARYALVLLDHDGSGKEEQRLEDAKEDLHKRLIQAGWAERCDVIMFEPELEIWVWSDSPHVDRILGWEGKRPGLRSWLREKGYWPDTLTKPLRPKQALEKALHAAGMPRSSSIYRALAESVGLERCQDPSFAEFKEIMRRWFGIRDSGAGTGTEKGYENQ